MQRAISHGASFRRSRRLSCARVLSQRYFGRLVLVDRRATAAGPQPLAAVGAHVVDQGEQRAALLGQLVLDPRRHLGIGPAIHDALLLEGTEPERQGPRADACQRALELTEAAAATGEVANHEDRPLGADQVCRGTYGALVL